LNNFIPGIKLTLTKNRESIDFLDLTVFRYDNKIHFKTFQKSINIYQYLPSLSKHDKSVIAGYIKGEILRYHRNSTLPSDRQRMIYIFFSRLCKRGFSLRYLHGIFSKINFDEHVRNVEPINSENKLKIIPLIVPFYDSVLTRILKRQIYTLNLRPECDYLKIRLMTAFKRSKNILELVSSSNISKQNLTFLGENGLLN
jgi:hypothetical protein